MMIIYHELGHSVVGFTNNDLLDPDVTIVAHRALRGEIEPLRRAAHLQFNYDGPFLEQ